MAHCQRRKEAGPVGEKRKISVRLAGRALTVLTDEDEGAVRRIERTLNERVEELTRSSPRLASREGRFDAVLLCAMDALNREFAAGREADALKKELYAGERKYRALLGEYNRLAARRAAWQNARQNALQNARQDSPEGSPQDARQDARQDAGQAADGAGMSREEKIARIRELLARERERGPGA